ncbi:MAG: nicotinate-nucleotide adenylyltransferase [Lachnospiraceae bacterium]|nr:nicotinate-nucleotide adenylyltransferase [Lachnospiraceae bacterium]
MEKVGIMGGTFNPIHISHLMIAARAYDHFNLDKVIFLPSKQPPHKPLSEIASETDRCSMIKAAIKDYPFFELSEFELQREGTTYTAETLTLLKKQNPDTKYYFIIGGDSIDYFDSWNQPDVILENCVLLCAPRVSESRLTNNSMNGYDSSSGQNEKNEYLEYDYEKIIEKLIKKYSRIKEDGTRFIPEIAMLPSPIVSVSSSRIREYVKCGLNISCMVPKGVEDYILSKGIYKDPFFEDIKAKQEKTLKPKRFKHVLDVAQTAYKLALAHGVDPIKAYTAGLLHDCAKYLNDKEILEEAEAYNIEIDEVERRNASNLLHSKVGAAWTRDKFGIEDEEIISSIYYHTTGKPQMSKLELIIYLADILEPGRNIEFDPTLDVLRTEASYDLELTIYHILDNVVPYILKNYKENVCTTTLDTYDYYKKVIKERK